MDRPQWIRASDHHGRLPDHLPPFREIPSLHKDSKNFFNIKFTTMSIGIIIIIIFAIHSSRACVVLPQLDYPPQLTESHFEAELSS